MIDAIDRFRKLVIVKKKKNAVHGAMITVIVDLNKCFGRQENGNFM